MSSFRRWSSIGLFLLSIGNFIRIYFLILTFWCARLFVIWTAFLGRFKRRLYVSAIWWLFIRANVSCVIRSVVWPFAKRSISGLFCLDGGKPALGAFLLIFIHIFNFSAIIQNLFDFCLYIFDFLMRYFHSLDHLKYKLYYFYIPCYKEIDWPFPDGNDM